MAGVNNLTGLTTPINALDMATNGIQLTNVSTENVASWGALGGFYFHGRDGVSHSWSCPQISENYVSSVGQVRGSYMVSNIAESTNIAVLLNSSPFESENQIDVMLDNIQTSQFKVNAIRVDSNESGTNNQRYCGFSCTIFGQVPQRIFDTVGNVTKLNKFSAGQTKSIGPNAVGQIFCPAQTNVFGDTQINTGLLAYGTILSNRRGFFIDYKHPSLTLSHEYLGGGGHHKIYTNFAHTKFSCNASHVYNSGADNICQVFQYGSTIELRSRYSRANDSWVDRDIYWSIYGII